VLFLSFLSRIKPMILPGLVSVTFRGRSPAEVLGLAQRARLTGIEWGGDVHVPHGNLAQAREVRGMTAEAGLRVCSYGSYYRVGHGTDPGAFEDVLATALELGAPLVRVWAGRLGSAEADEGHWARVIEDAQRMGNLAAQAGICTAFEFHGHSLTDTPPWARRLLEAVNHPAVKCYWQPPLGAAHAANLAGLELIRPWLSCLHVFQWEVSHDGPAAERRPLAEGQERWPEVLRRSATHCWSSYAAMNRSSFCRTRQCLKDCWRNVEDKATTPKTFNHEPHEINEQKLKGVQ
jgi:sugar phosphate isomerase/epimerase